MLLHISSHITSQSLSTLSVIEDFLSKRPMPSGIASSESRSQNWVRNLNYYSESSSLCCSPPPLHLMKSQTIDGLLRYAAVSQQLICSLFLLYCSGIILCAISGLCRSDKFCNEIHKYARLLEMSMLCVSVNEMLACLFLGLDGSTSASERERLINQFNDPENNAAWVFLLSTR